MPKPAPILLPLLSALLLSACATGPDYRAPVSALPDAWPTHSALSAAQDGAPPAPEDESAPVTDSTHWSDWWHRFGDPELDRLVALAQAGNSDIRLQLARIEAARAQLGLARAEQMPSIGVQAEAARARQSGEVLGLGERTSPVGSYSLAGLLGYEIDLWGRLANERAAAEALLNESRYARDAIRLAVVSDVVSTYFNLRAAERQLDITERTLAAREAAFRLEQIRFEGGETDELVLSQSRSELATIRAQIPQRIERVRTLESALAVLIGLSPAELFSTASVAPGWLEDIDQPQGVPTVLPSELLLRRPDLRASEATLHAAAASVEVARTARLPRINLSMLLGAGALQIDNLFSSSAETWSIGGALTAPLFDFGRNRARVDAATAQLRQTEIRHDAIVRSAFVEVRDALTLVDTRAARVEATREQVSALAHTQKLAELRYREGLIGMVELLDAQRALLNAELAHTEAISQRLTATAGLFKALGGGWNESDAFENARLPASS